MERRYLNWLKSIVLPAPNHRRYSKLIDQLSRTEFDPNRCYISYDDNRAEDGKYVRYFYYGERMDEEPCSILEMLMALAARFDCCGGVGFDEDNIPDIREHFWVMIDNLGLDRCSDDSYSEIEVSSVLDIMNNRTYKYDGKGGLFPLKHPREDQRKVEIWGQLQEFLVEHYGV